MLLSETIRVAGMGEGVLGDEAASKKSGKGVGSDEA